jgi:hypothetical protein
MIQKGRTTDVYKRDVCGNQEHTILQKDVRDFDLNLFLAENDIDQAFATAIKVNVV